MKLLFVLLCSVAFSAITIDRGNPNNKDESGHREIGYNPRPSCGYSAGSKKVLSVFESWGSGGNNDWGCAVTNHDESKAYYVRVMTTRPAKDKDVDFSYYYTIKPGQSILANSGVGQFKKNGLSRCRICGAVEASPEGEGIEDFQCRGGCYATLFENEKFSGASMTISSDQKDLSALKGISSIKVGKGCHLVAYKDDNMKHEVCGSGFFAQEGDTAWDMDAVKRKCNGRNDLIKSVKLYAAGWCLKSVPRANEPAPVCPEPCTTPGHPRSPHVPAHAAALGRLFKAMASVLEE